MDGLEGRESILLDNGNDYTPQEHLVYWIQVRDAIRIKKASGTKKPWTRDKIMQTVYFCNVNRENDKVTKWIRKSYRMAEMGAFYEMSIVAARLFNNPSTLRDIWYDLRQGDITGVYETLEVRQAEGSKVWSGAYVITTCGKKMSKLDYCMDLLNAVKDITPAVLPPTCQNYYEYFKQVDGLGSFLSAQIVADLKNTDGHPLQDSEDWYSFCAPGPGSIRGLNWVYYGSAKGGVTNSNFNDHISSLYSWMQSKRRVELPEMCMQDFQNCLCEFDKFMRVGTGAGKSKRKYAGA